MTYTIAHVYKVREARKMLTQEEIKKHVNPFDGARWNTRRDKRSDHELERQDAGELRREAKREINATRHAEFLAAHKKP